MHGNQWLLEIKTKTYGILWDMVCMGHKYHPTTKLFFLNEINDFGGHKTSTLCFPFDLSVVFSL